MGQGERCAEVSQSAWHMGRDDNFIETRKRRPDAGNVLVEPAVNIAKRVMGPGTAAQLPHLTQRNKSVPEPKPL